MALNYAQKNKLDTLIMALNLQDMDSFTNNYIIGSIEDEMGCALYPASILASLGRILMDSEYALDELGGSPKRYALKNYNYILPNYNVAFTKDKNIITFKGNGSIPVTYDFITHSFNCDLDNVKNGNRLIADMEVFNYEWLFNYTTNFDVVEGIVRRARYDKVDISKMPNGLLNYLNGNEMAFDYYAIKDYMLITKYGMFGSNFIDRFGMKNYELVIKHIGEKNLQKIMYNSIKNGDFGLYLSDFLSVLAKLDKVNIDIPIDTNRDIAHNKKTLSAIYDTMKDNILNSQLQKLNFINGFTMNDCVVVVPQNAEEKAKEGKMQNNCVGYYYDDSIREGRNFIYFIRKANSPDKSYITCRYNTERNDTVEYRTKNNRSAYTSDDEIMIATISQMIRDTLS